MRVAQVVDEAALPVDLLGALTPGGGILDTDLRGAGHDPLRRRDLARHVIALAVAVLGHDRPLESGVGLLELAHAAPVAALGRADGVLVGRLTTGLDADRDRLGSALARAPFAVPPGALARDPVDVSGDLARGVEVLRHLSSLRVLPPWQQVLRLTDFPKPVNPKFGVLVLSLR